MLKPRRNSSPAASPLAAARNTSMQRYCQQILRGLQTRFERDEGCWTVGITSCCSGAGVSTLAANLAVASIQAGCGPVLLIDARLEKPALHRMFDLPLTPGLADTLATPSPAILPLRQTAVNQLFMVSAGELDSDEAARLDAFNSFPDHLAAAAEDFRQVVVDLPPANRCGACPALLHALDGVVLIAEANRTTRDAVSESRRALELAGSEVLGMVINKQRRLPGWLSRLLGEQT